MFGKKRTNLSAQTIESMAKIYRYNLSTHGQKSLNHADLISNNDVQQMLNNVFEEGDLFNEDDDDELIPNEGNEEETSDVDEVLNIEKIVDLGPWIFIDNTTVLIITRHGYASDDEDDGEDWNPDEI
jgi:hypothetical protein